LKRRWIACLVLFFPLLAICEVRPSAAPQATVYLEDLTWTELRDTIHAGKTTVIIPIGGTEQSGPDIALGKHNVRVKALSGKIAQGLGNAIVAPVIAYVPEGALAPPTAHMRYPGTITVPDEVFEKMLEYAARSMKLAGFRNIIMLGDHGGYQQLEKTVAAKLTREWSGTAVHVFAVEEYYRASSQGFAEILKARGYSSSEIGEHAGLGDASLELAVAPAMVRADRLHNGADRASADGVNGDPRRASAELGQLGVDEIVTTTISAIRKLTTQH
jgi:creatinine amidohydrolase/Fe(II)-dependent formamide hydrolase-like protein